MTNATLEEVPARTQFLRDTPAFGPAHQIDVRLRRETPFEKFKVQILEEYNQAASSGDIPSNQVLRHLYHYAMEAQVDRLWVSDLQATAKTPAWKSHMKFVKKIITFTEEVGPLLKREDPFLLQRDVQTLKLFVRSLKNLQQQFKEILRRDKNLDEIAETRNWSARRRQVLRRMDLTLQRDCTTLSKTQRRELITLAIRASGFNPGETFEAVARQLSPDRKESVRRHR